MAFSCCKSADSQLLYATVQTIKNTGPYRGQKPGTSGLRKVTKEFMKDHYTENFVQCLLSALGDSLIGSTLVIGGDGRFYSKTAITKIIQVCAGNQVSKLIIGHNGIFSTPAVSCIIRKYNTNGGIILTASHNPGGLNADFGLKFNTANGGPAPDILMENVYERTQTIEQYQLCVDMNIDISRVATYSYAVDDARFTVEVIDPVSDYLSLMHEIFDFAAIHRLLNQRPGGRPAFRICLNAMHGVTGPYIKRIFCEELGMDVSDAVKCTPLENFGGSHPDPNLTYAKDLVTEMKKGLHDFAAAFDGDGDRNMILGKNGFFVSPCDSLAVLAANLECIPYFKKTGVKGFARSMPTSGAIDRVAQQMGKEIYVVPTGWKFFGNLMDADLLSLCGEESFGTGSDHIREKDGIWAVLAWLSIIAHTKKSVQQILHDHWATYGRNVYTRYDYEKCQASHAEQMMENLNAKISSAELIGKVYRINEKDVAISSMDNFEYKDPIDQSLSVNQGVQIVFDDGSRIVVRLSGTGSSGATIRMYIDSYEKDVKKINLDAQILLKPLVHIALEITELEKLTGRKVPTVIT